MLMWAHQINPADRHLGEMMQGELWENDDDDGYDDDDDDVELFADGGGAELNASKAVLLNVPILLMDIVEKNERTTLPLQKR
uniref:Uncharacterized protein n=1 Tax=Angiostrongylus cantonensis TaxID=6313 RepID=A0A0K0CZ68_ANGCA